RPCAPTRRSSDLQAHLGGLMRIFSEHVGEVYDLQVPGSRDLLDREPIDYRLSRTTGPRLGHRRGQRVDEIRKVQEWYDDRKDTSDSGSGDDSEDRKSTRLNS